MGIYDRIRELAAMQITTVAKVASELGFSNSVINKWNTVSPNADKLTKVADYFGVSTDFLLGRDKTYDSTERAELANLVQTLPADKVTALLTVARAMKD